MGINAIWIGTIFWDEMEIRVRTMIRKYFRRKIFFGEASPEPVIRNNCLASSSVMPDFEIAIEKAPRIA